MCNTIIIETHYKHVEVMAIYEEIFGMEYMEKCNDNNYIGLN